MSNEEIVEFDLNDFYDIMMSIEVKEKLKPFVRQFKKRNMYVFLNSGFSSIKPSSTSFKF